MDSGQPESWEDDFLDFDFSEYQQPQYPSSTIDPTLANGFLDSVNPAELQNDFLSHGTFPENGTNLQENGLPGPSAADSNEFFAMDEFFRSQGGWRPAEPCNHCRRLRLQCFMLQTTDANPNPVTSCSSCVALYRHCSLSGPLKRQASQFETPLPVIGQLHGLYEDEGNRQAPAALIGAAVSGSPPGAGPPVRSSKRSSSRSNIGTRPLRLWFSSHFDRPYPTEDEKENLAQESGLSKTQVSNWFSNARRRKKQSENATSTASREIYRQGSPMPSSGMSSMTPLQRWQHSPPDEEPAQFADIERALSSSINSLDVLLQTSDTEHLFMPLPEYESGAERLSLPCSLGSSSNATSSCNSHRSFGAHSASSKRSFEDASLDIAPRKRRPGAKQTQHICCTCARMFTRKSDLLRHERAIHLQSKEAWVCSDLVSPDESAIIWRMSQVEPECAYCGHPSPDEKHILTHEFVSCADRAVSERTFARKDHLWQHLYKFHRCRKWDGWALDESIERLRQTSGV
ncbi:hypothetical protein Q7P37_000787 [Cladosporium fusiforme]